MLRDIVSPFLGLLPFVERFDQKIEDAGRIGASRNGSGHGQANLEAGFFRSVPTHCPALKGLCQMSPQSNWSQRNANCGTARESPLIVREAHIACGGGGAGTMPSEIDISPIWISSSD